MTKFTSFAQFIRHGGQASLVMSLKKTNPHLEIKEEPVDASTLSAFGIRLRDISEENSSYLCKVFDRADMVPDLKTENVDGIISLFVSKFSARVFELAGVDSPFDRYDKLAEASELLSFEFLAEINRFRQLELGVTHYIWRSLKDTKVRKTHAERHGRLFSWDPMLSDGYPGQEHNCRCFADPAILDGAILLTDIAFSSGLAARIADAEGQGLQDALLDTAVDGAEMGYSVLKFLYLGAWDLGGGLSTEEAAEFQIMKDKLSAAFDAITNLDADTAVRMADAFAQHITTQHAELRQLDLEHRLGLVSEDTLLRAYRDVAYLDAATALGGAALTTAIGKVGVRLSKTRPRDAILSTMAAAARTRGALSTRRATTQTLIARRFAELEAQGHGPQRHEGAVTRQMLVDRVTQGIDPMTGTKIDGERGGAHRMPGAATRFTTEEAFVSAESFIRRSTLYRDLREKTIHDILTVKGRFEVRVSIEDALGANYQMKIEGIRRVGSRRHPRGTAPISFEGGLIIAVFNLAPDGEPKLTTMYPIGRL